MKVVGGRYAKSTYSRRKRAERNVVVREVNSFTEDLAHLTALAQSIESEEQLDLILDAQTELTPEMKAEMRKLILKLRSGDKVDEPEPVKLVTVG